MSQPLRSNRPSVRRRHRECRVYAFHMDPSAWRMRSLLRHNPHIAEGDRLITFPIYVGQTSCSIRTRYDGHCGLVDGHPTVWGRRFFMPTFESAFDREIIALRGLYEAEHPGVCLDRLSREDAERHEVGFGRWLRSRGYAVHFA